MRRRAYLRNTFILTALVIAIVTGCDAAKARYTSRAGTAIPAEITVTKLADILKSPQRFKDTKVLLSGIIAGICPSLCDLTYQEAKDTVMVYPAGFKLPKSKKGQAVRIYGEVKTGEERIFISALGVEVKNKGKEKVK